MKEIITVVLIIAIAIGFESCGSLADKNEAVRAAENIGMTDVKVTGHHWWFIGFQGCDEKDSAKFDIEATNASGKRVKMFVCTGWLFKGATIRSK